LTVSSHAVVVKSFYASRQILGIEVLNVLHRLLLTRDSYSTQKIVLNIVEKILLAAKERLMVDGGKLAVSLKVVNRGMSSFSCCFSFKLNFFILITKWFCCSLFVFLSKPT